MKHIIKFNEKFTHKWRSKDDLISSVWGITEDEIFDAISDVEDEWDVEIKCEFLLQSPKGQKFQLADNSTISGNYIPIHNDEQIEAFAWISTHHWDLY